MRRPRRLPLLPHAEFAAGKPRRSVDRARPRRGRGAKAVARPATQARRRRAATQHDPRSLHALVEEALTRDPAPLPRGDEERRGHRRGRAVAARPRGNRGRAGRIAVRPLPGHAAARTRLGHGNTLPDRISIYQRPIEEACEDDEEISVCVAETVIHEFGHYFGMTEERDRGDRGEVLARRIGGRCVSRRMRRRSDYGQHFLVPPWADKLVDGDRSAARRPLSRDRARAWRPDAAAGAAGGAPDRDRGGPRHGGALSRRGCPRTSTLVQAGLSRVRLVARWRPAARSGWPATCPTTSRHRSCSV